MSDDERTEEQKAADKNLEEAIDLVGKAYGEEGLLMEWVVVTANHTTDSFGKTYTSVDWFCSDDLPYYRTQGLLGFTLDRIKDHISEEYREQ